MLVRRRCNTGYIPKAYFFKIERIDFQKGIVKGEDGADSPRRRL